MSLTRTEYINSIKQPAINATKGTGLFPSVMIAQAVVESGNGNSLLASKYNNHFGIKAGKAWKGKTVKIKTREVIKGKESFPEETFRAYDTIQDGFKDRITFLKTNPTYTKHGVFKAKTPLAQITALKNAGYATDPKYVAIVNGVLEASDLDAFDAIIKHPLRTLFVLGVLGVGAWYFKDDILRYAQLAKKTIVKQLT